MATVHTLGRDRGWHVHVHVLGTEGGLRADGVWQPVHLCPAAQYRRLWQHYLLPGLRRTLKGNRSLKRQIGRLYRKDPGGCMVNGRSHYQNGKPAAAYCCRHTGCPPLSERRIVAYDGKQVPIAYQDYRDAQDKTLTRPATEFLRRLMQHGWPRYQRDEHSYGLSQPSRRQAHGATLLEASRYGDQVRPVSALSRPERPEQAMAGLLRRCPACGGPSVLEYVQSPRRRHATKSQATTTQTRSPLSLRM
jgi:hypothetical protein